MTHVTPPSNSRVLLINPPLMRSETAFDSSIYFPLGLLYVAAAIRDVCEVRILDCLLDESRDRREKNLPDSASRYQSIRGIISTFNPNIIGITVLTMARYKDAVATAQFCKRIKKDLIVVFGGPDPSVRYKEILKEGFCDYCVIGEGEIVMKELVSCIKAGTSTQEICGLAQLNGCSFYYRERRFIDNIDSLPVPAYDMIDIAKYHCSNKLYINRSFIPKNSISVITSRGCPFGCSFCSIHLHMGKTYRYHSPEYVMKHLHVLINQYKIRNIHFEDDNILHSALSR